MQPIKTRPAFKLSAKLPSALESQLDPESLRLARMLNTLLNLLIILSLFVYLNAFFSENLLVDAITASLLLGFVLLARWLLRDGRVRLASAVLTSGLWLTLIAATFVNQFEGNGPFVGLALVVIIAGLLLGSSAGFLVALLSTAAGLVYLALTQSQNALLPVIVPYSPLGYMITMGIIFFAIAGLIYLATSSLNEAVQSANRNEQAMAESNRQLEMMRYSLEDQITERTRILEQRTAYLQATIEVSRATASILDVHLLMQTSVDLIRQLFGLYYVGLFQMDPAGEWAFLQAGTGEPGKAMLVRGHRIRYGQGMIGWSIANAQPRVADDVGEDIVRLATSELPLTRSEAAIPLRSRGRVIGALTVQSDRPHAFGEMEITTFQALADQLAIALDNARLISESQQAVEETQRAYGQISRQSWADFIDSQNDQNLTYRYGLGERKSSPQPHPLPAASAQTELLQARQSVMQTGQPVQLRLADQSTLLIPIRVRDQIIGVVKLIKEPSPEVDALQSNGHSFDVPQPGAHLAAWKTEEVELLEAITEQLGAAMDSARLYEETRRTAERERLTSEITSQMRSTNDPQAILQIAARELRKALRADKTQLVVQTAVSPLQSDNDAQAGTQTGGQS